MGMFELLKQAAGAVGIEIPPGALPVAALYKVYTEIEEMDENHAKKILAAAQETTQCKCIELSKSVKFSPIGVVILDLLDRKRGCGFLFEGIPLWHPHARFDARALSARVYCYNQETDQVELQNSPFESCPVCSRFRGNP